jgi:ubiquinone/menaquinone biosynthesis C-methylase UbiE
VSRPTQIRFLSRAAGLYDPVVAAMGFPRLWERMVETVASDPVESCLDVCTGTGGLALALGRRGVQVLGVDAARGMIRRGRAKARTAGLAARVGFLELDARELPFPNGAFPLVTCCMALHEMSEPERDRVVGEIRRVTSDRVVVADYRVPSGARGWWFRAFHAYEYWESDDFRGYLSRDPGDRLTEAGLKVDAPRDVGAYRIWSCRVPEAS